MSKVCVFIDTEVDEQHFDAYFENMCRHARTSLAEDKGCERFDIAVPTRNNRNRVLVYEVWASKEDLATHSESEHTAQHRQRTEGQTTGRKLTICTLSEGGQG